MTKTNKRIAIIGATGMVGRELISILQERAFPLASLSLYASKESHGEVIDFKGQGLMVHELINADEVKADIAFFAAAPSVAMSFIPKLCAQGVICIDKSSAFRMSKDVPLVVPEVNGHLLKEKPTSLVASPNCVATPLVQVLSCIHGLSPLDQVVVSTYQAVSGVGRRGAMELESQVRSIFNMRDLHMEVFDKQIAFNVQPFIPAKTSVDHLGKTDEEIKLIEETKKILDVTDLKMDATCVRVPVFNGHSMSVNIATKGDIKMNDALDTLAKAPGIILMDNPNKGSYPTPIDASGEDMTLVGRVRPNTSTRFGLSLWISSDNIRTGAALNAVRIAETIMLE